MKVWLMSMLQTQSFDLIEMSQMQPGVNSQPVLFIMSAKPLVIINSFKKYNIMFTTEQNTKI